MDITAERFAVAGGPPKRRPAARYRVLVADPPWRFSDQLPGNGRGASKHYPCLSVSAIMRHPLPHLADDCVLFLWRVSAMVEEAYQVCRAWGFTPKSEIVWDKVTASGKAHFGMGHIVRAAHETAIIAIRGRPRRLHAAQRSRFEAPAPRSAGKVIHSAKPDEFFAIVAELYAGPRASIFERRHRTGFDCIGDHGIIQPVRGPRDHDRSPISGRRRQSQRAAHDGR